MFYRFNIKNYIADDKRHNIKYVIKYLRLKLIKQMPSNSHSLSSAISALKSKNPPLAVEICNRLINANTSLADAYHIKALAEKSLGRMQQADLCFQQSLEVLANQPAVLSNYANLLMSMGKIELASQQFNKATKLAANNMDAWLNWAIMLCKTQDYQLAINKLQQALSINNRDYRLYTVLGNANQQLEYFDDALKAYETCLQLNPHDIQALHNKGITFRIINQPQHAIECYQQIINLGQSYPELYYNLGCAYYDLNNKTLAITNLQQAIALKTDYVDAHEALNKLYWEDDDKTQFLASYHQSLIHSPKSKSLIYSFVAMLIMSKQNEQAKIVLQTALKDVGRDARFLHALAIIKNKLNDHKDVLNLLKEAVELQPHNIKYQIDIANNYIQNKHYALALKHLDIAHKIAPLNQEVLAYMGLCWRLMQNPLSDWLNNYQSFIHAAPLDLPPGYSNLAEFMHKLKDALYQLHKTENQPLDQSVMGGTQTVGRLLAEPTKVIQDFKHVLEKRVYQYLEQLPKDLNHPFLKRVTQHFKFSGSWSVRLKSGGFHVNHVHPEGWLSCCTYVDLPDNVSCDDPGKSGWIKFGETSLGLNEREKIGQQICPEIGLCVIFPSYFWHGTNAFESDAYRLTIPCDIMPIKNN